MNPIKFEYDVKFLKEMNRFIKKCPSIEEDFKIFLKALQTDIQNNNYRIPLNTKKYAKIAGLNKNVYLPAFVAKRFRCRKINKGSKSGIRITFIYDSTNNLIYFIQIYFKSKDEVEDKNRINKLFK